MEPIPTEFAWPVNALPEIRTAGRFPLEDRGFATSYVDPSHALHVHNYDGQMRLGDRTITLRSGDVTISPAQVPSAYDLPKPGHHWCAHFMPAARRRADQAAMRLHLPLGSLGDHAGQRIMAIAQLRTGGADPVASAAASAAMLELLLWLSMQARVHHGTGNASRGVSAIERVAALIHERFSRELCIADLADEVHLTQNYLARMFRFRYGTTMPHFLLTCRMDHARHLLRHTAIPISRVAAEVGMPDPQHFNKQFRRLVGMSPTQFRGGAIKEIEPRRHEDTKKTKN